MTAHPKATDLVTGLDHKHVACSTDYFKQKIIVRTVYLMSRYRGIGHITYNRFNYKYLITDTTMSAYSYLWATTYLNPSKPLIM